MTNYTRFNGKLLRLNKAYPIYDNEDNIIGFTKSGDLAVITYADMKNDGYFETVIVSGEFLGITTLALDFKDIMESTFIFNQKEDNGTVMIADNQIEFEYV